MSLPERATRKRYIDRALEAAGWHPIVPYDARASRHLVAFEEHPTDNGPADYVLYLATRPLARAKSTTDEEMDDTGRLLAHPCVPRRESYELWRRGIRSPHWHTARVEPVVGTASLSTPCAASWWRRIQRVIAPDHAALEPAEGLLERIGTA